MENKTSILSFRVSRTLKEKLEINAGREKKTVTEFVRDLLADSQGEKAIEKAKKELDEFEAKSVEMSEYVNSLKSEYVELMSSLLDAQKKQWELIERRRKSITAERNFDTFLNVIFCFCGGFLGSMAMISIRDFLV